MPLVERTEVFDVDIETFYSVIIDYAAYPEFVDGVSGIEILNQDENEAEVEYSLNLIKTFSYILHLKHERPNTVEWNLKSGDIFKSNKGSWTLKDLGDGKTEVTYSLDVVFKGFAPKMIVNKLVSSNLPSMMKSYYKRAKSK